MGKGSNSDLRSPCSMRPPCSQQDSCVGEGLGVRVGIGLVVGLSEGMNVGTGEGVFAGKIETKGVLVGEDNSWTCGVGLSWGAVCGEVQAAITIASIKIVRVNQYRFTDSPWT